MKFEPGDIVRVIDDQGRHYLRKYSLGVVTGISFAGTYLVQGRNWKNTRIKQWAAPEDLIPFSGIFLPGDLVRMTGQRRTATPEDIGHITAIYDDDRFTVVFENSTTFWMAYADELTPVIDYADKEEHSSKPENFFEDFADDCPWYVASRGRCCATGQMCSQNNCAVFYFMEKSDD
jgi:hypothetical protein